jgi:hypothetical protein
VTTVIADFERLDRISLAGAPRPLAFADLTITVQGTDQIVGVDALMIRLAGYATPLAASDFQF